MKQMCFSIYVCSLRDEHFFIHYSKSVVGGELVYVVNVCVTDLNTLDPFVKFALEM